MAEDEKSVLERILGKDAPVASVQQEDVIAEGVAVPQTEPVEVVPAEGECPHGHGSLGEDQVCATCGFDKKLEVR